MSSYGNMFRSLLFLVEARKKKWFSGRQNFIEIKEEPPNSAKICDIPFYIGIQRNGIFFFLGTLEEFSF